MIGNICPGSHCNQVRDVSENTCSGATARSPDSFQPKSSLPEGILVPPGCSLGQGRPTGPMHPDSSKNENNHHLPRIVIIHSSVNI
jgi:hypothetical protein